MRVSIPLLFLAATVGAGFSCVPDDDGGPPGLSEAQLNQAIADHVAQASAHHTKTTDATELVSGTLDAARLPDITLDTASITSAGEDGSVLPHNCAWTVTPNSANDAFVTATCPAGHPISGACVSGSLSLFVVSGQPVDGGTIIATGDLIPETNGWGCIFSGSSMSHIAQVLCCNY